MIPNFRIETSGKDLTEAIRSRLLRLTVKDEASWKSDAMTLELIDDGIEWPEAGQEFSIALGYDNVLTSVGRFATKHVGVAMDGRRILKIEAAAMEQSSSLKSQREQSWDGTTLGAIAEEIARRNGLKPAIFDELKSIVIEHEDQTESDLAFLCRLGRRHDLTIKVSGRYLMLTPADRSGADPDGTIPVIRIEKPIRFEYSGDQTSRYTGVRAFWYDNDFGEKRHVMYGKEGVVLELEYNKITEAGARKAAETKFREVVRKGKTLTLTVPGNVQLAAERKIDVQGFGAGIDGEWVIKSVEHAIDGTGFASKVECCVDGYEAFIKPDYEE
ncbi:MAG TPA: contractile injection system protein, VgrG/Pvc8 family [Oligoflexus sp.]|uniref:phage late control D family protein n=1 Tax=Oligoflexus sp. TaxID=1971216 RepID=UPI002D7E1C29|nr:contractile injection system protein, VgrG/Pvc8 family [Oligoflexus sp.]HET9239485.1 contractile injection system protein, VgrG/Pvc8 family [Oligoflexus sp.]